jgi:hypothetical protein
VKRLFIQSQYPSRVDIDASAPVCAENVALGWQ